MTRIQRDTTRVVPTGSRVDNKLEEFVVTFYPNGSIELRPKRARRPEATVMVTWGQIYRWALGERSPRRRRIRRSVV